MNPVKKLSICLVIILSFFASSALYAALALPTRVTYVHGIMESTDYGSDLLNKYNTWKTNFISNAAGSYDLTNGSTQARVVYKESGSDTRSEGIGYAMILAVYFNDQALFDQLWNYKVVCNDGNQLMKWHETSGGFEDGNSATDADEDIAFALMQASKRWGGQGSLTMTYATLANDQINRVQNYDINGSGQLKNGDNYDTDEYPSYYRPAWYPLFDNFMGGGTKFTALNTTCNSHLASGRNSSNGLVDETLNHSGANDGANSYGYNSCRLPLWYGIDEVWNGDTAGSTESSEIGGFFAGITAVNVGDGYNVSNGSKTSSNHNGAFVGPAGVGIMGTANTTEMNDFYTNEAGSCFNADAGTSFFDTTLGLLSMLVEDGYFPQTFGVVNTPTNTPTGPTATPTNTVPGGPTAVATVPGGGCNFDDMENDTNANYYGGYWYSYLGGTPATVWPAVGANLTPSAGGANSTLYAMRVTGTVGVAGTTYPCVGMGSQFTATSGAPTYTEFDVSACTGMKFYVKGNGSSYLVKIPYTDTTGASLTGFNDYEYVFTAPTTWTQLTIPFALMSQAAGWGTSAVLTTVLSHATQIQWQSNFNAVAPATSAPVDLWIDEVAIYGCPSCPAQPTPFPTATNTPGGPTNTNTNTATFSPTPTATNTPGGPTSTNTPVPTATNTQAVVPTNTPVGGGCVFDNMEDGDNGNQYGGFWYSYLGGTPATVWPAVGANLTPSAGGANSTLYAMRVTGTVGVAGTTYPCIGMGSQFTATSGAPTYTTFDISACTGMKFYTKGNGSSYLVKIPYTDTTGASLTGFNDYEYIFTAPAAWTQLTIPFALMSQAAGWGTSAVLTTVLSHAKEIQWQSNFNAVAPATSAPVDFWIDEVVIYGCPSCPAAPTAYPTATNTIGAATATFTNTPVPPTATNTPLGPTNTFTNTPIVPTATNTPLGPTNTFTNTPSPTNTVGVPTATNTVAGGGCNFDDMEDDNNGNNYGGFWYSYLGGTPATVWPAVGSSLTPSAGGANSTLYAMRVTGTVGVAGTTYPCVGMGSQFTATSGAPTFTEFDISACTGMKFYTKGNGSSYLVKIPYTDTAGNNLTGYNDYEYIFTAPAAWTQLTIPFALMSQAAGWGTSAVLTTVLAHAKEIQWQSNFNAVAPATSAPVDFWIDEVVIYGCPSCPAAPTAYPTATNTVGGATSTNTPLPTNTFTNTPIVPTNTFTNTPLGPTNTFTNTPSPTNTVGVPTATSTLSGGACNFDDMENDTNANYYGGYWYSYLGGTPATVWPAVGSSLTPSAGGANSTLYAMRVTGTVGVAGTTYPCVGMGTQFTATSGAPTFTEFDISACTGMKFYTKGNGSSYLVKIPYTDTAGNNLTGYNDYEYIFTAPAAWTQLTIPFALMSQAAGWGTSAVLTTVLQHAKEIQWQSNFNAVAPATSAPVDFWIDEVVIYGCPSCPAAPTAVPTNTPVGSTATNTPVAPTATNTAAVPTNTNTAVPPTNTFTNTPSPTITNTPTPVPTATTSSNPSLSVSIVAQATALVGQTINITVHITNNGSVALSNVQPLNFMTNVSSSVLTLVSAPTPDANLAIGASVDETYVYTVASAGTASITTQSEGTNQSVNDVQSPAAANGPFSIALSVGVGTPTDTATPIFTATAIGTATPTWSIFKVVTPTPMPGQTPIGVIGPNPNPTPGVPSDRVLNIWVSKSISKIEVKIYSKAGRLVRYFSEDNTWGAGSVAVVVPAGNFAGLARGAYFLVITATSNDGDVGKSSIEKILIN